MVVWFFMERPRDRFMRTLGLQLILGLCIETLGWVSLLFSFRTGPANSTYNLVEMCLVVMLVIADQPLLKRAAVTMGALATVLFGAAILAQEDRSLSSTQGSMFISVIMSLLVVRALWGRLEIHTGPLLRDPRMWVYLGFLCYFVTSVPIVGSTTYIWKRFPDLSRNMYLMLQFMATVRYVMASVACMKYRASHEF